MSRCHSLGARRFAPILACLLATGCGGNEPAVPPTETASGSNSGAVAETGAVGRNPSGDEAPSQQTRWLGDIPYDAFYDRPLEVYRDEGAGTDQANTSGPVSLPAADQGSPVPTPVAAAQEAPSTESSESDSTGTVASQIDWEHVAPIDALVEETKEIRTRLAANLQTVATFNANLESIETDGSILSLMAGIIERHPGELSWKDRAPYVRQLAYDIYLNASGRGRTQFNATKEPFEKIVTIWNGGPAPDAEVQPDVPLGETGDRARVMKRIDQTFKWLRSDINTAGRMKEHLDQVLQETSTMAVLGTALGDESFDASSEDAYRMLLLQFIDGQRAMAKAAKDDDFEQFEQARSSVQKSCDACHLEYRTRSSE